MDLFIIFALIATAILLFLIISPIDLAPLNPIDDLIYFGIIVIIWSIVGVSKVVETWNSLFYGQGGNAQLITGGLFVMILIFAGMIFFMNRNQPRRGGPY